VLGSFAGSLFAHYVSFVSVDSFGVGRAINFLLIAVLGGVHTIAGTALGALFVTVTPNLLTRFGDIHALLFAILLVVTVIFLPEGFGGIIKRLWVRFAGTDVTQDGARMPASHPKPLTDPPATAAAGEQR
jgi:branched-chain amino acid transport system permease protein